MGLALGLPQHMLDAIYRSNLRDVDDCFRVMLNQRLSTTPILQWSHIISALRQPHVGLVSLANKLAQRYDSESVMATESVTSTMSHILLDEADQIQPTNPRAADFNGKGEQTIFFSGVYNTWSFVLFRYI